MKDIFIIDRIEKVPIADIAPFKGNERINDHVVPYLVNCINEVGFLCPIVIDDDNVVVAGHTRLKAAIKIGMPYVPCVRASHLTSEQVDLFRIADNQIASLAQNDEDKLAKTMEELSKHFQLVDFGFVEPNIEPIAEPEPVKVNMDSFKIIVECEDENDAQEKFERIREMGYKCSLSTL